MDDVLVVELDAVAVVDVVVRAHPLVPREPARVAPDLEERLQEAALLLDGDVRAEDLLLDFGEVRRLAARAREAREALAEERAVEDLDRRRLLHVERHVRVVRRGVRGLEEVHDVPELVQHATHLEQRAKGEVTFNLNV